MTYKPVFQFFLLLGSFLFLSPGGADRLLAAPDITQITPRGLQVGSETTLTIEGAGLSDSTRVLMPLPIASQKVLSASDKKLVLQLSLGESIPAGIYPLRVVNPSGASSSLLVSVDDLPQVEPTENIETLPVAITTTVSGSSTFRTQFQGKKGEYLVIETEGRRLGANLNPTLRLLNARNVQLAWSAGIEAISGDARIVYQIPRDDTYTVLLHDLSFRAQTPNQVRLKIGNLHFADTVLPLGIERTQSASLSFPASNFKENSTALLKATGYANFIAARFPDAKHNSGSTPPLFVSDHPERTETTAQAASPQELPAAPVAVSGTIARPGEQDQYRIPVQAKQQYRVRVFAQRVGSPLDAVLTISTDQGKGLVTTDDTTSFDPETTITIPDNTKTITATIRDYIHRGGRHFVYRLQIVKLDQPSFTVTTDIDRLHLPPGGHAQLAVQVDRQNYTGPVRLHLENLPSGISAPTVEIPATANSAIFSFASSHIQNKTVLATLTATGNQDGGPIVGTVRTIKQPGPLPRWYHNQIVITPTTQPSITIDSPDLNNLRKLIAGTKVPLRVNVRRNDKGAAGPVRIRLVSSQRPAPLKYLDRKRTKPQVDPARALRLAGQATLSGDTNDTQLALHVPPQLQDLPHDLALRAELLSADNKKVLAVSETAAFRLPVTFPPPTAPHKVFEDEPSLVAALKEGLGEAKLVEGAFAGKTAIEVVGDGSRAAKLPGLGVKIREFPAPGEYRFLRYAWKKVGGKVICIQLGHDGKFGHNKKTASESFRYHAGPDKEAYGAALVVSEKLPAEWTVVTRDLFADFGEFQLDGMSFDAIDGESALFDSVYLGRTPRDFDQLKVE